MMSEDKTKAFIIKAKLVHGDRYGYSLVDYTNNKTKIKIICKEHGIFEQLPTNHLQGKNCLICSGKNNLTTEQFISKAQVIHGYKYDYSNVTYKNNSTKVKITCLEHGNFEQIPNDHLQGKGCLKCGLIKCNESKTKTTEYFIMKANEIHYNSYDYSLVDYKNTESPVIIKCNTHGKFEQIPRIHLQGSGCPLCCESKGEKEIRSYLISNNIEYIPQHRFPDCKLKKPLAFDFYLPKSNLVIEFDGIQHYKPVKRFGGEDYLKVIQVRDKIKTEYCIKNNIKLVRIKYNDNLIEMIKATLK